MILDTSGLLAALDRDSRAHRRARDAVAAARGRLVLSPFVLAELDYLLQARLGRSAQRGMLGDVASGAYELVPFDAAATREALVVIDRYADLDIGLTDASLVVLADRYRTNRILTLDERHFRAIKPLAGGAFELLPADA